MRLGVVASRHGACLPVTGNPFAIQGSDQVVPGGLLLPWFAEKSTSHAEEGGAG